MIQTGTYKFNLPFPSSYLIEPALLLENVKEEFFL